jgi:hypothetical protein
MWANLAHLFCLPVACGSDVPPIVHYLRDIPSFLSGVASHLRTRLDRRRYSATAAAARLSAHLDRLWRSAIDSRREAAPAGTAAPVARLAPGRQWEIVMDLAARELARAPKIAALQARAALKIDAAEHALSRIVADCAKVLAAPVAPAPQPALQLAPRPEALQHRPLAA